MAVNVWYASEQIQCIASFPARIQTAEYLRGLPSYYNSTYVMYYAISLKELSPTIF